jgi:hypothetical protein
MMSTTLEGAVMNTTDLPSDVSRWTDEQKQSVLIALAQEFVAKQPTGVLHTNPVDSSSPFFLLGLFRPSRTLVLDDSTEELRELRRRDQAKNALALDPILDELIMQASR